MHAIPSRHQNLRRFATAAFVVAVLCGLGAIGLGAADWALQGRRTEGVAFIYGGIGVLVLSVFLYSQLLLILKFVNYAYRTYDTLLETLDLARRSEEHSRIISENSSLSEWAKRVVYREKDYEFLRDTIQSAIVRQDWESAEHLIRDMDREFGYHDEAAHLREKLDQARESTTEERVAAAMARFEGLCQQHKWEQARLDCERLAALYPEHPGILGLPAELERRWHDFKDELLRRYDQAVRSQDVDHAHALLFELDRYIAPDEAEALKESARGVFRARLEQIKTQFTIAVSYKQFPSAIEAGERLIREFPNSGYAREISKLLPILRQRVKQQTAHATTAARPAT
jgi:predicted NAD-dependent protein-ADP-ribosyltransferase YbiA (DUF1768 family)